MDIIDIMLAKAMTPQGKTDAYVAKAKRAAQQAAQAEQDAATAIATVEAAADEIATAKSEANDLLTAAQEALETAQSAQINTLDTEDVDTEIKKMTVNTATIDGTGAKTIQVITTYPDNTLNTQNVTKLYKATGQNEDGTMTQKAITTALDANKTYVDNAIANSGGSSGGSVHMNSEDAGHLVTIDENGNLAPSTLTDEEVINAITNGGSSSLEGTIGVEINYAERTTSRVQGAVGKSAGSAFNSYKMYGGRTRCNVADNGTINAFYGDNNYTEDGSNGQVMVYQPKFYYKRIIHTTDNMSLGKIVRHETLLLSETPRAGFKLAPIFNGDLDYVLLPAFNGSIVNDKLSSIAGALPANNISIANAESAANARGTGWHIMTLAAESANQMLEIVEFGSMNGQMALGDGITYAYQNSANCRYITGSTAALGNGSGQAQSTQVNINGTVSTMSEAGYLAINYRGMENPWGCMWSMMGDVNVSGNGSLGGGVPYICTDYNFTPGIVGGNYASVGFTLPAQRGWISAMGYGNEDYDWVYLPVECDNNANSLIPVGDTIWPSYNLNGVAILATCGAYSFKEECGPFVYGVDHAANDSARKNYSAKLIFIPTKNEIYTANIAKWNTYMGG